MTNFLTKDQNSPSWVGAVSNKADQVSNKIQEGNEKLQNMYQDFENYAAQIGIPQGFLGREDSARGLSSAVNNLLETIDRTSQRSYIGHGFADYERRLPNTKCVVTQTPEAIVLIKKRMFSSLSENFKPEFLSEDELHYIKASKKLFQNKCEQISAYEKLTKLNKILIDTGVMTSPLANLIYETVSQLEGTDFNQGGDPAFFSSLLDADSLKYLKEHADGIKKIRDALTLNGFNQTTTWIGNTKYQKQAPLGYGTGVIELTLVTNLNTRVSVNMSESGICNFTVSDPYRLFMIDEFDIEKAMMQTSFNSFSLINITADTLEADTELMKQELNTARSARGASILTYFVDVSSKIYNKITIILDRIGYQLTKSDGSGLDYDGLATAKNVPEWEAFTNEEKRQLNKIYKNLFRIMQIRMKDFTTYKNYNKNINYTRKLMRMNYLGRQLIQPMDTVTIFVDSQTIDDKLLSYGMNKSFNDLMNPLQDIGEAGTKAPNFMGAAANTFGSTNFLGLLNKTVGQIKRLGDRDGFSADDAMKNILVGKDFPYSLWSKLRSNFVGGNFGTCIFCGLIERVSENYNDGTYSLTVSAKDNSAYFEQGWIQTQPGLDQFNGALFDPLTPFDFEFDPSTGQLPDVSNFKLLNENRKLLNSTPSKITIPDGKRAGEAATLKNFGDADVEPSVAVSKTGEVFSSLQNRIYTVPDGFVYRWKRGIGTAIINQSGTSDGSMSNRLVQDNIALVAEQDPFGGQDLANVASILICGEPYNFNTFFQAAKSFGNISLQSNFNPDSDFFQGFFRRIKKQNKIWGDFIPFKKLSADPDVFGVSIATQMITFAHTTAIRQAQDKKARLLAQLMQYEGDTGVVDLSLFQAPITSASTAPTIQTSHPTITIPIIKQILELDAEIQIRSEIISEALREGQNKKSGTIIAVGDNVYYNSNKDLKTSGQINTEHKLLKADQNELTKRRLWQVKANTDRNLFIVGSEYDQDYDIQTLSQSLTNNFQFINTNWQQIKGKLTTLAVDILGMELFANTQGHIELRAPKYNRMPSSVLFDMIRRKAELNIQIYPNFLEKTFKNQAEATFTEIEEIEDQIRIRCIALGSLPYDTEMQNLLSGSSKINGGDFLFVTDETGTLTSIRNAVSELNNEYSKAADKDKNSWSPINMTSELDDFFKRSAELGTTEAGYIDALHSQANSEKSQFDISKQIENYNQIASKFGNNLNLITNQESSAAPIRARLAKKLNVPISSVPTLSQLLPNSSPLNGKLSPVDINKLQNEIQSFIIRRYEALQTAVNLIKNLDSAARINSPNSDIFSKLLLPNLYGTENIPEFLQDMVEDELVDDLGLDSGKRFVIREKDIFNMTYQEENPEYTQVNVTGSELGGLVGDQGFNIGNNIQLASVWAVDYDLWRQYGFKSIQQKHLPFLNNPELQLAPFAMFLLNKERAKLINANVTIRGNEFIQPGEVYYLQERGMLFYSKTVSHNFSYGGSFKTTIDLNYGHVPGEYIPTPLDVIGKNIYRGEHFNIGNYRIARSGTISNTIGTNIGCFVFPNLSGTLMTTEQQLFSTYPYGATNTNTLADIKGKILFLADKSLPTSNSKYQAVTVRVYSDDTELISAAQYIVDELCKVIPPEKVVGGFDDVGDSSYGPQGVMEVNLSVTTNRNPSNTAMHYGREFARSNWQTPDISDKNFNKNDEFIYLKKYIIDVWIEDSIVPNETLLKQTTQATTTDQTPQTYKDVTLANMQNNYTQLKEANILKNNKFVTIIEKA